MDLYRTAAVSGVADAMNCLGLLLEEGRGKSNEQSRAINALRIDEGFYDTMFN
jgi:TPR repeat protein